MDKQQLPAEVLKEINQKAHIYARRTGVSGDQYSWRDGATEYARKLHQAGQCNTELRVANTKMRNLLSKFISRHEGGLLPDMFIYKEIKTFLDGTK